MEVRMVERGIRWPANIILICQYYAHIQMIMFPFCHRHSHHLGKSAILIIKLLFGFASDSVFVKLNKDTNK